MKWEYILDGVRRLKVDGGWLYQVQADKRVDALGRMYLVWHAPVFVPEME